MSTVKVQARSDYLEKITKINSPIKSIAELIWNGFDAGANKVSVFFDYNSLGGIDKIRVWDNGKGIVHANAKSYFENLGGSWKKQKKMAHGRVLHGKSGKGRFLAYSLGKELLWDTTYEQSKGKYYSFIVKGNYKFLDQFDISDEKQKGKNSGTEVIVSNLQKPFNNLLEKEAISNLTVLFAVYLTQYPDIVLEYNGKRINPDEACKSHQVFTLENIETDDGIPASAEMEIYEWNDQTKPVIHLCNSKGVSLYEIPITHSNNIKYRKNHTIHIKSDYFQELDYQDDLIENNPLIHSFLNTAKQEAAKYFLRKKLEEQCAIVERWKKEEIYPYHDPVEKIPVTEKIERRLFDVIAVNVEKRLPFFSRADQKSKKFTFRLLMQTLKDNPESLQTILNEVLGLSKKEQDNFAKLLEKTSLTSIITASEIITNRLDFLKGLRELIYDTDNKKVLLERDQLHKIIEKEVWLFGENFALSASEANLDIVLKKHLSILGKRKDEVETIVSESPVLQPDGRKGRIDLMLHKVLRPREDEFDYLIVELKRPLKKIDSEVIGQVKRYAQAVADDERFNNLKVRWEFIVVSNEIHKNAGREINQTDRPKGLVFTSDNIKVWAKCWSEIISEAESRLKFIQEKLSYEADDESADEYLQKFYAEYIPSTKEIEDKIKKLDEQKVRNSNKKKSTKKVTIPPIESDIDKDS
ncbi:MAG: ATP-binding protein [Planctomycetaceae bacterium]|jgi:hypothetical protein|nr:ATP-binding protein [Planctomycetaceae bacterium]